MPRPRRKLADVRGEHGGTLGSTLQSTSRVSRLHVLARETNPQYPPRLPVPDDKVSWLAAWSYKPLVYCAELIRTNARNLESGQHWADPDDPLTIEAELKQRITVIGNIARTLAEAVGFDSVGRPRNPCGRTGLRGRGLLGRWGPNHTADIVLTSYDMRTGRPLILAVQRGEGGAWTIPCGMIFDKSTASTLMVRLCSLPKRDGEAPHLHPPLFSQFEHADAEPSEAAEYDRLFTKLVASGRIIKRGYLDDQLNTDNAWMEVTVYHFECPPQLAGLLQLCDEPGNRAAWLEPGMTEMSDSQQRYLLRLEPTVGPLFL